MIANTSSKKLKIIAGVSALFLAAILVVAALTKHAPEPLPAASTAAPSASDQGFAATLQYTNNQLAYQSRVDADMLKEMNSGRYTFQSPLVVVDPYNQSPMTAMVIFKTDKPERISIYISGVDTLTDVDFEFRGFDTSHMIPAYGLYPDKENQVTLTATGQDGQKDTSLLKIKTEPLPDTLSQNIIKTDLPDKSKYQPGFNFCYMTKSAFDAYGQYRWFLKADYLPPTLYNYNNHFIVALGATLEGDVLFYEINQMGRIYRVFYAPYGVNHDITQYQDGNLLITGSHGYTSEDFIYEMNILTGQIQNTLDLRAVFQRFRPGFYAISDPDWFHLNAIDWVQGQNKIIVSGRHQSLVAQISWPAGTIDWMLASPDNWLNMFQKYLLKPTGDTILPYNQHAPEILPDIDNNPDTMDILLFDNGDQRFDQTEELLRNTQPNAIADPKLYSRMVQYRINLNDKTVQQIWEFGKEEGSKLYSFARGSAKLLANGNQLGVFSIGDNIDPSNANYIEVDNTGQIVWQANAISTGQTGSYMEYRAERKPLYNDGANDLQIGTPAINLIPKEVYEKEGIQNQ